MPIPRLRPDACSLLVIDVQERLLPTIADGEAIAHNCGLLAAGAAALGLPILVTEQYVKGLGPTVAAITGRLPPRTPRVEKTRFSAVVPETERFLREHRRPSVLVCGVEAQVCVLQTTLDLLARGWSVFLATDAISSGQPDQIGPALARMHAAGATFSGTLGALYELVGDAADPRFKAILPLAKDVRPPRRPGRPSPP
jgi:nicotinamidase-related amidase